MNISDRASSILFEPAISTGVVKIDVLNIESLEGFIFNLFFMSEFLYKRSLIIYINNYIYYLLYLVIFTIFLKLF